eukprot:TRINITY_DN12115_c0_g1_i1.p1 TRINITY_DN12115_c0_g1~~TRINITY_DN12115_c0_g1_i1.p1  ORF type:complete len:676 (+),score=78.46 TRINITY_DN12115_c0_g1_i1:1950-3977(+)
MSQGAKPSGATGGRKPTPIGAPSLGASSFDVVGNLLRLPPITRGKSDPDSLRRRLAGRPQRTQPSVSHKDPLPTTTGHGSRRLPTAAKKQANPVQARKNDEACFSCSLHSIHCHPNEAATKKACQIRISKTFITLTARRNQVTMSRFDIKKIVNHEEVFCILLLQRPKKPFGAKGEYFRTYNDNRHLGSERNFILVQALPNHASELLDGLKDYQVPTGPLSEQEMTEKKMSLMSNVLDAREEKTESECTSRDGLRRSSRRKSTPRSSSQTAMPVVNTDDGTVLGTWPQGVGGITVTKGDMNRLHEHEFLNDIIINIYLRHLEEQLTAEKSASVKIFNSFFFSQYMLGFDRVARWTKKIKLFDKDFVVIPINESAHWYVAIICFPGMEFAPCPPLEDLKDPKESPPSLSGEALNALDFEDPAPLAKKAHLSAVSGRSALSQDKAVAALDDLPTTLQPVAEECILDDPTFAPDYKSSMDTMQDSPKDANMQAVEELFKHKRLPSKPYDPKHNLWKHEIHRRRPCILILDSLGGLHRDVAKKLREYLSQLWKRDHDTERAFTETTMPLIRVAVPEQDNSTDCGIFLLSFVESFLKGGASVPGGKESGQMGFDRYSNGGDLDMKSYFKHGRNIPLTRTKIRRTIKNLLPKDAPVKQATTSEDKTTHSTNDDGEEIIELD